MNAADIIELRRLRAAATQGPWTAGDNDWDINAISFTEHDDDCVEDCTGMHNGMIVECGRDYDLGTKNDRDLIVAVVNVLPALLDRLEHLDKEADDLRLAIQATAGVAGDWKRADQASRKIAAAYAVERDDERAAGERYLEAHQRALDERDARIAKLQDELAKLRNPGHTCGVLGPCDGACR